MAPPSAFVVSIIIIIFFLGVSRVKICCLNQFFFYKKEMSEIFDFVKSSGGIVHF